MIDSAGIKPKMTVWKWLRLKCYKLLQWLAKLVPKNIVQNIKKKLFKLFASSDYSVLNTLERETFKKYCQFRSYRLFKKKLKQKH